MRIINNIVIGLDIATKTGFAVIINNKIFMSGVIDLSKIEAEGDELLKLRTATIAINLSNIF